MFFDSKFKTIQQLLCQCLCLPIGVVGLYTASSLKSASGQQIQQPNGTIIQQPVVQPQVFQQPVVQQPVQQPIGRPPSQIYQSPSSQGPIYQSPTYYPNQGQIIQSQPLPGRVYQPPVGVIQTVPPVAQRVQQPSQPTPQQTLDAEQAAYNAERLALVEKLLEKYKVSDAENQAAIRQLEATKQKNAQLVKRMNELNQTTQRYQTQILTLQEKLAVSGNPDPAMLQKAEQLKVRYQEVVDQTKQLESKIQTLAGENENYLDQIASLKAAREAAMNLRPAESNQLEGDQTELARKNQQLAADNQALGQSNTQLRQDYIVLKGKYDELSQQQIVMNDNQEPNDNSSDVGSVNDIAEVNAGSSAPEVTPPSVDVSSYETKISELNRKNRQLAESNSDFKDENRSLSQHLASLEKKQGGNAVVNSNAATIDSTSLSAVLPAPPVTENKAGWGILGWLIPFLAIGLGVAFFVIMREELHRSPAGTTKRPSHQD